MSRPFLSVIVPAHEAAGQIADVLAALRASDMPAESWELIVVDDASTDDTELVAARYADTVIRLAGNPHGPAYARNRAAETCRGDVLVFVDADVVVQPDALRRFAALFAARPDVSAAFGSYDPAPHSPGLVSQYRNLLHHFVHQRAAGRAETFWAGLGAVRRSVFLAIGMFDEWHYSRPLIEDIELGRRLRRAGHEIVLDPRIMGKHLKRWTLKSMLVTDLKSRGVPWMWLLLQEGPSRSGHVLNLRVAEKLCTALIGVAGLCVLAAIFFFRGWWLSAVSAAAVLVVLFLNRRFYALLFRAGSFRLATTGMLLHVGYYVINILAVAFGSAAHTLLGEPIPPAERQAFAQIGAQTWPPVPKRPSNTLWSRPGDRPSDPATRQ